MIIIQGLAPGIMSHPIITLRVRAPVQSVTLPQRVLLANPTEAPIRDRPLHRAAPKAPHPVLRAGK